MTKQFNYILASANWAKNWTKYIYPIHMYL